MPKIPVNLDEAIRFSFEDAGTNLPSLLPEGLRDKLGEIKTYDDFVSAIKNETKLDNDTATHVANTTVWAQVEKSGLNPINWFASLPRIDQQKVKYGPEEYGQALKFFGSWANVQKIMFFIAIGAAIAIAIVGLPAAIATGATATRLLLAGESFESISKLIQIRSFLQLPKLLIPVLVGVLARMGFQLAQTQETATGDLLTYIRQGVARSEGDLLKLGAAGGGGLAVGAQPSILTGKTRITMAKTSKPTLLLGTIFSQRIGDVKTFERVLDDKITDSSDLRADAQANLNKWLASLPGRMDYKIRLAINPRDEHNQVLSGQWVVLDIVFHPINGKDMYLDTVPLGPIDPIVYAPTTQQIQTVQLELPKLLKAEEISKIEFPSEGVSMIDKTGTVVPVNFAPSKPIVSEPAPGTAPPAGIGPQIPGFTTPESVLPSTPATPASTPALPAGQSFVHFEDEKRAVVTPDIGLNVRNDHFTSATKITALPKGTTVIYSPGRLIYGDGYNWVPIWLDNPRGVWWVVKDFLRDL